MHGLSRLARRFILMLGGEVTQSAFHFGINIVLARSLSPHDYGRFAILFLVGGLALTYIRSLAGVPATITIPPRAGRRAARGFDVTFGTVAVILSAAIGAGVCAALMATSDINALAGSLFVGLWSLRSYLRLALFAKHRPAISGLGDVVFALSGTAFTVAMIHFQGAPGLDETLFALACANGLGIVASLALLREPIRLSLGRSVRRRYGAMIPTLSWSLVNVTTANVQGQGQSLLVAAIAGPAAYAPMAATFVLFSPLRLSASALINMVQPEVAGHLARGEFTLARRFAFICSGLLGLGCIAYGAIILWALELIEHKLFAGQFTAAPMTLIAVAAWAIVTVSLIHAPMRVLMETMQEFRPLAVIAGVSVGIGAVAVIGLLLIAQPAWSLFGVLGSEVVVLAGCLWMLKPWSSARHPMQPGLGGDLEARPGR
ncbi:MULTISPECIES: hypothetical protein [unclassified Methylobacterium]|uniref:hypothetical protein n=1 Tax=unclassified Methylobacterium TaxID=2615210 RepID=UPI0006FC679B|nr:MULTISPECIES: hypothetical protein [unclassified Methylobacterium]KQO54001.1 hypothetical protein ASF24_22275 [Methylobacterium sp. Leaf86]KQO93241.1 hypothetical protein ASF32_03100 [Methylobacterium sp. Leaf91]